MDLTHNMRPRFTRWVMSNGFLENPMTLVDVGVLGGIQDRWKSLRGHLKVEGFDALEEATLPLRARQEPLHRYHTLALGNEDGDREIFIAPEPTASSFYGHGASRYDVDASVARTATSRNVSIRKLDSLLAEGVLAGADFIKIDCEGFEPEILEGAQELLKTGTIGLEIESNLNTSPILASTHFGTLSDQLLPHGFLVYDLAFDRIPRATFARRAKELRIMRADTVARPGTLNVFFYRDTPARDGQELLKRVIILELYGFCDTAYDELIRNASLLSAGFPLQEGSDKLIGWKLPRIRGLKRLRNLLRRLAT